VAIADVNGIVARRSRHGSFNTVTLLDFLADVPLEQGTVILLDNVAFHRSRPIAELAIQRGWTLLFTPPYSPWFNPIEGMFSIIKRHFYKHASIDDAFDALKPHHATAFFDQSFRLRGMPV
jgi:transposase